MESIEEERKTRAGWRSFGPELLVIAGGATFAILGRGRWVNLTEDHGFWYSATQSLLAGGRAMHEVRLQYGPVSLWVLEGACRIFGTSVRTLVVLQFVIGLGAIAGVQLYSRRFLRPAEQWISAAILVTLIVWMAGPGNLLYPCAFAMSHGLFLLMATMFAATAALRRSSAAGIVASGALAAVTMLTKQEFGVSAAGAIFVLIVLEEGIPFRSKCRRLAFAAGGFAAGYAGTLELARHGDSFRHLFAANLLWPWVRIPGPWRDLYRRTLGLDDPRARLIEAFNSSVSIVVFAGTIWFVLLAGRLGRRRLFVAAAALALGWSVWYWRWTDGSHFRPMVLTLPAILASPALALRRRRKMVPPLPLGALTAVALGAAILLQREGYRGAIDAYYSGMGYVLAVPVAAPLLWAVLRGPGDATWQPAVTVALAAVELASFGAGRLRALESDWRQTVPFTTARGTVHLTASSAPALIDTAAFLDRNSRPGDSVLVLPNTFGLDFLLDRKNLSFFPWVSPGFLTPDGERDLIRRCESSPPAAVVIFEKSFGVLRSGDYGSGFATALTSWLDAHYPRQQKFAFADGRQGRRLLPAVRESP